MKISIMQPTFLPWTGYFEMILKSDLFVFLDDVQFEKRSYQSRNKIIINDNEKLISVPVKVKNKYDQNINQVEIDHDRDWTKKLIKTIIFNYSRHKYFDEVYFFLSKILKIKERKLIDLNYKLIIAICEYLEISVNFQFSSKYSIKEKKSDKILGLIKACGGKEYLTPKRTKDYLGNGDILKKADIDVSFFDYRCKEYSQRNLKNFISHLSIIDLLFNHGKESKKFL